MLQKIVRVGNSAAVTIPKEFMTKTNLVIGDEVIVQSDKDLKIIFIKSKQSTVNTAITPEFKNWLDGFMLENHEAMKELAQF